MSKFKSLSSVSLWGPENTPLISCTICLSSLQVCLSMCLIVFSLVSFCLHGKFRVWVLCLYLDFVKFRFKEKHPAHRTVQKERTVTREAL